MTRRAAHAGALALALAAAALGCPQKASRTDLLDASADAARGSDASRATDAGDAGEGGDASDAAAAADTDDGARPADETLAELTARMRHLVEAIAQDNPDLAQDVLFPKDAFAATHEAKDAHREWTRKIARPFQKAVSRLHAQKKGAERAKFGAFSLGAGPREVAARRGELKRSLWRVKHSRLDIVIDGKTLPIEIAEMTSWRGNWYVTRLR